MSFLPCSSDKELTIFLPQVDDEVRQKGSTGDMIFNIPYLISHISSIMTLMEGDVILTGMEVFMGMLSSFFLQYVKVLWVYWRSLLGKKC